MQTKPWQILSTTDPAVYALIERELKRQRSGLELIASENFASSSVVAAAANVFTNKYAEGLPGKRYYGGCHVVDELETLAIDRVKKLFGAGYANVQPHSGAQANAAVFLALLQPGDKILGLDLSHGGHLTHGSKVNFSGSIYESHFYQLDPATERLDYNRIESAAKELKPKVIVAGASAYARTIDFAKFRQIADSVGATLVVDMAHIAGLVAAGLHPSPLPHAHITTTTTHKTLRGPRGGLILWNDDALSAKLNKGVFPGTQGGPLEHIIAAKAVCFLEAQSPAFATYQKAIIDNAKAMAAKLLARNMRLVTGGTDNHLMLLDLSETDVSGKQLEEALGKVEITVNKNTVPNEKRSPFVTSGIRIGTPAVTSRGMGVAEMGTIAELIIRTFQAVAGKKENEFKEIEAQVHGLAHRFPLYADWN